jgi:hypothetical protein
MRKQTIERVSIVRTALALIMAGEQKLFLKHLKHSWQQEFPFLSPVHVIEVPQVPRGCNFICERYALTRSRYYFMQVDLSPKRRGQFSISVAISPRRDKSTLDSRGVSDISPMAVGSFGIWQFMQVQRFDWALVDTHSELISHFGGDVVPSRSAYLWVPTTYEQPLEEIISEALTHVNQTLRECVFPRLEIAVP